MLVFFHNKFPDTKNQLKVGEKIAVIGDTTKDNKVLPRFILHNIPKEFPDKHEGTILRIFPQKDKLEIQNNEGKKEEIQVNSNTILRSKDTGISLDGMKPGSRVTIFGEEQGIQKEKQNIKLFAPTQVPTSTANTLTSSKESNNQKVDNTPHTNQSSSDNHVVNETKVIKATSITVTQNGSGANVQTVTQPSVQKQEIHTNVSNTTKENKKDTPNGSDNKDNKNEKKDSK